MAVAVAMLHRASSWQRVRLQLASLIAVTFAESKVSAALHGSGIRSKLIHCLHPMIDPAAAVGAPGKIHHHAQVQPGTAAAVLALLRVDMLASACR